ncbi:MAG: hypothetical protein BAJALOKI3v1_170010 [Promethearchaeota archaeon]|jgi:hypothetical protein|nr:MAG: hypothetical protein BAJALOKI3v1_170010 [Candidatus Lokiarchaeota archaeon]
MEKADYIQMILDNIAVFDLSIPDRFNSIESVQTLLNQYDTKILKIIAGFNQGFLKFFLKDYLGESVDDFEELIEKLEKLSYLLGPMGNLTYLSPNQVDYVLNNIDQLKIEEINEKKISMMADKQLEDEFGGSAPQYSQAQSLENQISSAKFYLREIGYEADEINEKIKDVRDDPSKLDALFNLPPKEIYNMPPELEESASGSASSQASSSPDTEESSESGGDIIEDHIQSIQRDISDERAKKVNEIIQDIKDHVKDKMTQNYERVYRQMHPDRLKRAYKFLKDTKHKHERMDLYLEWFFSTHLLENIELKVEHWQVSSQASHGNVGVYTAGTSFSRYDPIIKDFSDSKLSKVIKIARKILRNPSKKRIQKLGQDLIAETGFDEHLYFTD